MVEVHAEGDKSFNPINELAQRIAGELLTMKPAELQCCITERASGIKHGNFGAVDVLTDKVMIEIEEYILSKVASQLTLMLVAHSAVRSNELDATINRIVEYLYLKLCQSDS